jgi:hypothetical protein
MGQAILDLPDPSQLSGINAGPLSPQALASADDLLSQLAGDDIDRLLAEAEAERPRPAIPPALEQPPAPAALAPQVTLSDTPDSAAESPADSAAESPADPTSAEIDAILGSAIDSTLKAVDEEIAATAPALELSPAIEFSPAVEIPAAVENPAALEVRPAVDVPPVDIHSAIEISPAVDAQTLQAAAPIGIQPEVSATLLQASDQQILNDAAAHLSAIMDPHVAPPETAVIAPAAIAPAAIADDAERQALAEPLVIPQPQGRPSFLLRLLVQILEWINAPMRFLSDPVREAIGKIAILTTCNAAAVILYVMVFRRPHH